MAPQASRKSKTSRFPVARIKKIMQMDEDVGKLASATPVMISKSLECFMQALITEASAEAQKRGSKKLTAYHLKQSINTNEQFDFLREIVSSIPDPTSAAAGPSSSSDPHSGGAGALPKRRSSGVDDGTGKKRGRKPKSSGVGAFPPHGQAGMGSGSYHYPGEEDENGRGHGYGHGYGHAAVPETKPAVLPSIGTWKRDMEGGGGMGEGGRGMFDDYEEDEEDY